MATMNTILYVFLLAVLTLMNSGEIKSQVLKIEDLEHYYDLEEKLVANVQEYLKQQKETLEILKQRYEDHKRSRGDLSRDKQEQYLGNPLNIHALIRRMISEWPLTLALLNDAYIPDEEDSDVQSRVLPSPTEYADAISILTRLQRVHNMTAAELVSGAMLTATDPSSQLTGADCYFIGQHLYEIHHYKAAMGWFKESLKLIEKEGKKGGEPIERTLEYLALASCFNGDRRQSKYYFHKLYMTYPTFYPTQDLIQDHLLVMDSNCVSLSKKNSDEEKGMDIKIANLTSNEIRNLTRVYEKLCRSEIQPSTSSSLRCRLSDMNRPHLRISPAKVEVLRHDPPVIMVHGFVSSNVLDKINNVDKVQEGLVSEIRKYLNGSTTAEGEAMRKLVELTPVQLHHDDTVVVSNYAAGTEQQLHQDAISEDKGLSTGDRVATMLIYVQSPEAGGELVFPHLGLSVAPSQGSVLFWYNLDPHGYPDSWAINGACPILYGHKSTITTWVVDQEIPSCSSEQLNDYKSTTLYKLISF